jgi:RimJ/RimL family protein N-acetyltransferase
VSHPIVGAVRRLATGRCRRQTRQHTWPESCRSRTRDLVAASQRSMTFSPMPLRIETERLVLTPTEPGDAEWFTELLNARGTGTFTVPDVLQRIDAMNKTTETTGIGALVLRKRPDGEALGYTAIVVGRCSLDEPEVAYELLSRAHGHGYATEAARALLDAAFDTGRRRIWATIGSWNAPSLRVAEKLGFRRDRCTTESVGEVVWMVCDCFPVG